MQPAQYGSTVLGDILGQAGDSPQDVQPRLGGKRKRDSGADAATADATEPPLWRSGHTLEVRCAAAHAALTSLSPRIVSLLAALEEDGGEAIEDLSDLDTAAAILHGALREPNTNALWNAVAVLGPDAVRSLLTSTASTEAGGGGWTADGTRRRTTGGVFFSHLKGVATKEQYKLIFLAKTRAHQGRVKARRRVDGSGAGVHDDSRMHVDRPTTAVGASLPVPVGGAGGSGSGGCDEGRLQSSGSHPAAPVSAPLPQSQGLPQTLAGGR